MPNGHQTTLVALREKDRKGNELNYIDTCFFILSGYSLLFILINDKLKGQGEREMRRPFARMEVIKNVHSYLRIST